VTQETHAGAHADRSALLAEAMGAHQQGHLGEAEALYDRLLRDDPHDADALHFLGLLRFQQRRAGDAERLIRGSLDLVPGNAHAWNNLGNLLLAGEQHDAAVQAYLRAVDLDIELAAPWKNLGECLERCASPEQAISLFRRIIETVPGFVPAYDALGRVLRVFGRHAEAIDVYRRWVELEPDRPTARHMLAALSHQDVPVRASDAYVRELFDAFADDFDQKLTRLEYRAPDLVLQCVRERLGPPAGSLYVLDAGCGTGWCGPMLRPYARWLAGVDLSAGMIAKAERRACYDELVVAELGGYLARLNGAVDLILSADTFCYFGALEDVFAAARGALAPGGWFVLTVEAWKGAPASASYRVESHGRYVHAVDYVRRCLLAAGFVEPGIHEAALRKEIFQDVHGWVVAARTTGWK